MSREQERNVIEEVTLFLQEQGYTIKNAYDGEEYMEKADVLAAINNKDTDTILDWAMASDGGSISFNSPSGGRFAIHMIYGNSPEEVIYDISASNEDELTKGTSLVNAKMEDALESMSEAPAL